MFWMVCLLADVFDGNPFDNGLAPPPTQPLRRSNYNHGDSSSSHTSLGSDDHSCNPFKGNKNKLTVGPIVGIALGSLLVVVLATIILFVCIRKKEQKDNTTKNSFGSLPLIPEKVKSEGQEQRRKLTRTTLQLRPLTTENIMFQKMQGNNGTFNVVKSPVTATSYNISTYSSSSNKKL